MNAEIRCNHKAKYYDSAAQRWKARPDIEPCWRGDYREWMMGGDNYANQLFCKWIGDYINPSGHTCELCKGGHLTEKKKDLRGCQSCQDEMLAKMKAEMTDRPKVSCCINTHNEGPRLRATVEAIHANLGEWPHEFVIIADGVTDGCCDFVEGSGFRVQGSEVKIKLLRNLTRLGCGRCKCQAIELADGDVLMFFDAHQNVICGKLSDMAVRAFIEEAIFTPVIRDIEYDKDWNISQRAGIDLVSTDRGMQFEIGQYTGMPDGWAAENHLTEIRMVGVGFAVSRATLKRIGGFNAYHGTHGSQERGISLRAFMARVPVRLDGSVVLGHEFRRGRRKPVGYRRNMARGQAWNFWHAYFIVAGDAAFQKMKPILMRKARGGHKIISAAEVQAERERFQRECKRRPDSELLSLLRLAPETAAVQSEIRNQKSEICQPLSTLAARLKRAPVVQHPAEMSLLFQEVARARPAVFLEVGSESGGSLYAYAGACAEGATIIAVDDGRTPRCVTALKRTIDRLRTEGFTVTWVIGDSHAQATIARVRKLLRGRSVEFLHIDGDHSEKGVRADYADFGALVREGGLIAFHDIEIPRYGVKALWRELRAGNPTAREFRAGKLGEHEAMGIGLVNKRKTINAA